VGGTVGWTAPAGMHPLRFPAIGRPPADLRTWEASWQDFIAACWALPPLALGNTALPSGSEPPPIPLSCGHSHSLHGSPVPDVQPPPSGRRS
jgi:hypothetical protein